MRRIFTTLIIMLSLSGYSQVGSDQTQVNIILSEVYSIEVMQSQVDLTVDTAEKYEDGTSASLSNHIKVFSTVSYQIDLQLSTDFTNGSNSIPAGKVKVKLSDNTTTNEIPLSTSSVNIIPNSSPVINRYLNAVYTLEGGNHLLLDAGTYSAQLTYTLIPQ